MSIARFFRRRREDADLAREMEAHIAHEVEENRARGESKEEALRQAYVKFGNPQRVREDVWQWNTVRFLESTFRDLRYAARTLRRSPGFAFVAILVMALGIGANTALFSIVHSILLQPLPFKQPDRLVMLYEQSHDGKSPFNVVAPGIFTAWQKQNHSFDQMALFWADGEFNLSGSGSNLPEKISATLCSWNFFSTLGVQPAYGRSFLPSDDTAQAEGTVVLSWGLWKRRFGGDPALIGKDIFVDDKPRTVIGIMPSWFSYPDTRTQLWAPVHPEAPPGLMELLDSHDFHVVARLKPGVTMAQGVSDLSMIERRIHDANPTKVIGKAANIRPLLQDVVGDYKTPLIVLLCATGCVLLIACLNFANLLVARSAARRREVAIRSALGVSRGRLLREQLAESIFVTVIAAALGLAFAHLALLWVVRTRQDMARANAIHIDGVVLLFTLGITLLSGAIAGAIAAVPAVRKNVLKTLQESSRLHGGGQSRARLRKTLLSLEVGLTVILLIAAGLLLKSYKQLRSVDLGCGTQNILTMRLSLPDARYKQPVQQVAFFEQLLARMRALPGIEAAGLVTVLPGAGYGGDTLFRIKEHPPLAVGQFQYAIFRRADPGYFAAMQIPLLSGRPFMDSERLDNAKVTIITQAFALRFFASGEDPLGKHLSVNLGRPDKPQWYAPEDYEIVGVVGDARHTIAEPSQPTMYFPIYLGSVELSIALRASQDSASLAVPAQKIIAELDPDLPVSDVLTMDQISGKSTTAASFNATLVLWSAVLSLLLAAVGLYGVLSYLVTQRTSEIGIRLALGSPRQAVVRLMLLDGLKPACFGLGLGLLGGALASRLIRDMLYGVKPLDPSIFVAVALVLALVACAACVLPAWRASRLDAMQALRTE
jgi:predicted permease